MRPLRPRERWLETDSRPLEATGYTTCFLREEEADVPRFNETLSAFKVGARPSRARAGDLGSSAVAHRSLVGDRGTCTPLSCRCGRGCTEFRLGDAGVELPRERARMLP